MVNLYIILLINGFGLIPTSNDRDFFDSVLRFLIRIYNFPFKLIEYTSKWQVIYYLLLIQPKKKNFSLLLLYWVFIPGPSLYRALTSISLYTS